MRSEFVFVEDVRTIFVNEQTIVIVVIVGVPADVIAAFDNQDRFTQLRRKPLGNDASGKTGSNNKIVKHFNLQPFVSVSFYNFETARAAWPFSSCCDVTLSVQVQYSVGHDQ